MSHLVNESGYPVDPELFRLESRLSQIAAGWRGARDQPERQAEFVREYHATMAQLITQGWDVRLAGLDPEDTLPDALMPEAYLRRHELTSVPAVAGA